MSIPGVVNHHAEIGSWVGMLMVERLCLLLYLFCQRSFCRETVLWLIISLKDFNNSKIKIHKHHFFKKTVCDSSQGSSLIFCFKDETSKPQFPLFCLLSQGAETSGQGDYVQLCICVYMKYWLEIAGGDCNQTAVFANLIFTAELNKMLYCLEQYLPWALA